MVDGGFMNVRRWAPTIGALMVTGLWGCSQPEPAFRAPQTYKLQGTSVVASGPPDALCGAASNEALAGAVAYMLQPARSTEFEVSLRVESDGAIHVTDSGCEIQLQANEARDRLSASNSRCDLAADGPLKAWGITERTYLSFVLDFTEHTWSQSSRSLAVDNNGKPNVQCVVAEGIVLEAP
jgi:hypothetical protein